MHRARIDREKGDKSATETSKMRFLFSCTNFISIAKTNKENPAGYWQILRRGMLRLLMKSQGLYALQTEYQTTLYFPQARSFEFKEFTLSICFSINLHKTRELFAFWLFNYDFSISTENLDYFRNLAIIIYSTRSNYLFCIDFILVVIFEIKNNIQDELYVKYKNALHNIW